MKHEFKNGAAQMKSSWYVWVFPLFALIITGYLFFKHFYDHGREIRIMFDEVSVIEAEKTRVRYRGVEVGLVKQLALAEDRRSVIVYVRLAKGADSLAVEGSKFWVVTPKVSLQGLTGLDTILSGPYIEVAPGSADAQYQDEFKAKPDSDIHDANEGTSSYLVETSNAESISPGAAITYRGLVVGTIGKITLNKTSQAVSLQINIQNKYVKLIRANTVFWRKVGIQADLGLFGSDIKVNSLDSIMRGGLEFATPDNPAEVAKAHTKFDLAAKPPKDSIRWNPKIEI